MPGFWSNQRVYLTGGTGFIGTALAARMLKQGAELTCLTRKRERAEHLAQMGATVVEGNVTDPDSLAVPESVTTVVHAAAWVAYGIPRQKRELFHATNVEGTRNVVHAAREADANTFCHVSSVAAIGATPAGLYDERRVREGRVPMAHSDYEETKHTAHLLVEEHAGDMRVVLPMPGVVLGRGSDTGGLLKAFLKGRFWDVRGDNPQPFVHLRDTVDGIARAIERGEGSYVLVDQNLTVHQLLELFEEASGVEAPERSLSTGVLKALATVVQLPYHLRGKVPPLSRELVENMEIPHTYSSLRAAEELGWDPDLAGHLAEDFRALKKRMDAVGR